MKSGTITSIFINSGITQTEGDRDLINGLEREKEPVRQYEAPRGNIRVYGREL